MAKDGAKPKPYQFRRVRLGEGVAALLQCDACRALLPDGEQQEHAGWHRKLERDIADAKTQNVLGRMGLGGLGF